MAELTPEALEKVDEAIQALEKGGDEALDLRADEIREYGEEAVLQADEMDMEKAVETLQLVKAYRSEAHYRYEILYCGATYLRERLPFAFNLGFEGKTGAGKSACTKEALYLCYRGEWVSETTEAALTTLLDQGSTLGFDEADALLKAHKNDLLEAILRMSSDPESKHWVKEQVLDADGKVCWELRPRKLFAFKIMNFIRKIEPALASRTLILHLDPTKEIWIIQRSAYYEDFLAPVRIWLRREVRKAAAWDAEKIKALILSDEMNREMSKLPSDLSRDRQIGMVLLAVTRVFGWDMDTWIHEAIRSLDDFREDELQEEIRAFLLSYSEGAKVWVTDLRKRFNEEFRKGEKSLSATGFGNLLSTLGVSRNKNRKKGGRLFVDFTKSLLDTLSPPGPPSPLGPQTGDRVDQVDQVGKGVRDRILAKVFKRNVGGPCDLCKSDGENVSIVAPRGSHEMVKVCPPCAETRFDFGPPSGVGKNV